MASLAHRVRVRATTGKGANETLPASTSFDFQRNAASKRRQKSFGRFFPASLGCLPAFFVLSFCAYAFYTCLHHDSHDAAVRGSDLQSQNRTITPVLEIPPPFVAPPAEQTKHAMYRPELDPIYPGVPRQKVRVRVLLMKKGKVRIYFRNHSDPTALMSDEVLNICLDGWNRSPFFEVLNWTEVPDHRLEPGFYLEETDDVVWVVDMRRFRRASPKDKKDYTILDELVILANETVRLQQVYASLKKREKPKLRVVLMDYRDYIVSDAHCSDPVKTLIEMLGPANVRIVMQQTVRNRRWDNNKHFVQLGNVYNPAHDNTCLGRNILQVPYTVRSDIAEAVNRTFTQFLPADRVSALVKHPTPVDTVRPVDVAHFWEYHPSNIPSPGVQRSPMACHLRNMATRAVERLAPQYKTLAKIVSPKDRTSVADAYVQALLTSKIVVVAQRDAWEDHYRLFEALASGALVFTDPMLTLPAGLVDRQSIVVYQSEADLTTLLLYYLHHDAERLAIAKRGWEIAMTQHQTHHWMERLFFGEALTT